MQEEKYRHGNSGGQYGLDSSPSGWRLVAGASEYCHDLSLSYNTSSTLKVEEL
jgi:hypothetical protein